MACYFILYISCFLCIWLAAPSSSSQHFFPVHKSCLTSPCLVIGLFIKPTRATCLHGVQKDDATRSLHPPSRGTGTCQVSVHGFPSLTAAQPGSTRLIPRPDSMDLCKCCFSWRQCWEILVTGNQPHISFRDRGTAGCGHSASCLCLHTCGICTASSTCWLCCKHRVICKEWMR